MKQKKKVFAAGVGIGILLTVAVTVGVIMFNSGSAVSSEMGSIYHDQEKNSVAAAPKTSIQQEEKLEVPEVKTEDVIEVADSKTASYDEWSKTNIYIGGDQVVYQGKQYKAKWWTQGEIPGKDEWGPWNYIKDVKTQTVKKSSSDKTKTETTKTDTAKTNTQKTGKKDFKVVVYYPSWSNGSFDTIQFDIVTHINYAFAIPKADGTLMDLEQPEVAKKLIKEAHKKGVKVNLAVGGWSYNGTPLENTFMEATSSSSKIKKFGDAILKMCDKYGFDGVDMDWEHPRVDGDSSKRYESLMIYLGKKLHKDNKLLTSAVVSGVTSDGNVYYDSAAHTDKVIKTVDWFNVMAYDGGDGERHSSYQFAVNCAKYWKNTRKMPAEKVVLGVPFYGRPSWAAYKDILAADPKAYSKDKSNYNGMEAYYNGVSTIKKKTNYAVKNLGGIMVWEITQDTTNKKRSLLTAIGAVLQDQ